MCRVPKWEMDNLDASFEPRTKENMLQAVRDALRGVYPGWEEERGVLQTGEQRPPLSLFKENGELATTRAKKAAARIGRHLEVAFFDDLNGVDLHTMVQTSMYYVCTVSVLIVL